MEQLIALFIQHVDLTEEEIHFIQANTETCAYPKNHLLLEEGKTSTAFYFVLEGCLRLYYLANAEEKNAFFYKENMFVSSFLSFTKQLPAKHNIATIEACTLLKFDLSTVDKFMQFSPKFGVLAKIMMENELIIQQAIVSSFVTQNAEQRYKSFTNNSPDLIQRIPQHHIATYLGVSPETLSRIKKRSLR